MKALLNKLNHESSDVSVDESVMKAGRKGSSSPQSRPTVSKNRLHSMKMDFEDELRYSKPINRKKLPLGCTGNVSRPDSRPASPSSPTANSPRSIKRHGVQIGFSLSFLIKSMIKAADSVESRECLRFLGALRLIRRFSKANDLIERLLRRKRLNHKFHAILRFREACRKGGSPIETEPHWRQCILPVEISTSTMPLRAILPIDQASLALFAGLGKVVGTILSILRIHKMNAFSSISNRKLTDPS